MRLRNVRSAAVLCLVLTACGGETPSAPLTYSLSIVGRAERGLAVRPALKRDVDSTLVLATNTTVSPADAGTVLLNGDVQLNKVGAITITTAPAGGSPLSVTITVVAPPMIVFEGLASGNRDIYKVALDGVQLTRLTTNAADDVHPTATGTTVVFTSYRDGNAELYSVAIDGTSEKRLTTTTAVNETQPWLAPDARHVVYSSDVTGTSKVWLGNTDFTLAAPLSGTTRLSPDTFGTPATVEATPAWAPTSDKIVLMTTATNSGGAGLFTATAAANANPILVTGSGTAVPEVEPAWSFDGFFLAYASTVSGATEIFIRDLRTSTATQLSKNTGNSGQPAFLPDGRVVFTTFNGATSTLQWIDPALPTVIHPITTTGLSAAHAAPIR